MKNQIGFVATLLLALAVFAVGLFQPMKLMGTYWAVSGLITIFAIEFFHGDDDGYGF